MAKTKTEAAPEDDEPKVEKSEQPKDVKTAAPADDVYHPTRAEIQGTRNPADTSTHIERINRGTTNPAHIPGVGPTHPVDRRPPR